MRAVRAASLRSGWAHGNAAHHHVIDVVTSVRTEQAGQPRVHIRRARGRNRNIGSSAERE